MKLLRRNRQHFDSNFSAPRGIELRESPDGNEMLRKRWRSLARLAPHPRRDCV
jgi:hypothetical protein